MGEFFKKTITIGGAEIPLWVPIAAGIVVLLIMALTGQEAGTGSDWVTHNEG